MKCMKNEGLEDHTRGETQDLGWNLSGEDEKNEKIVFGGREIAFLLKEIWKSEIWFRIEAI